MAALPTGVFFTQGEIDIHFWNYCVGLLDMANMLTTRGRKPFDGIDDLTGSMNSLASTRIRMLAKQYERPPGYTVYFTYDHGTFSLKRVDPPKS